MNEKTFWKGIAIYILWAIRNEKGLCDKLSNQVYFNVLHDIDGFMNQTEHFLPRTEHFFKEYKATIKKRKKVKRKRA